MAELVRPGSPGLRSVSQEFIVIAEPNQSWWSQTESPKSWMSVRDADLYETLLHRMADRRGGAPLRVLEWGGGRSTVWYTHFLATLGSAYRWLTIEHDRKYFTEHVAGELLRRDDTTIVHSEDLRVEDGAGVLGATDLVVVLFDAGELCPFQPGRRADRQANLDDYVALPRLLGFECDVAVIDGRKRRRCILEAAGLLDNEGLVLVHDAWRTYYQCAFSTYVSGRRFGDEWWVGSHRSTDFRDLLPWHAFESEAAPGRSERCGGVRGA